jgi:hypothetical protein
MPHISANDILFGFQQLLLTCFGAAKNIMGLIIYQELGHYFGPTCLKTLNNSIN